MNQNGVVCLPGPALLFFKFRFEYSILGPKSYRDNRETGPWALINFLDLENGRLFEVGANSRLGAYSNKYGITRINNFNYASRQPVLTNQKHVVELLHTIDLKRR